MDSDEQPVEGGVVELAKRESIRHNRLAAVRVGDDVGGVEEFPVAESAERALHTVGGEHSLAEGALVQADIAGARHIPPDRFGALGRGVFPRQFEAANELDFESQADGSSPTTMTGHSAMYTPGRMPTNQTSGFARAIASRSARLSQESGSAPRYR